MQIYLRSANIRGAMTRCKGAALLLAMIILTLISSLAGTMVWQQWRAIYAESAERDHSQTNWIFNGALDWAITILESDNMSSDHMAEPWAIPMPEIRLSSFLALDKANNASDVIDDDLSKTFLSAEIIDAQSRYNLSNLVNKKNELDPNQVLVLQRIFQLVDLPADKAQSFAQAWHRAITGDGSQSIIPDRLERLIWFDFKHEEIKKLEKWLIILPTSTPININTADSEVLAAVFPDLGISVAQNIAREVKIKPFTNLEEVNSNYPIIKNPDESKSDERQKIDIKTNYFLINMVIRLPDRELKRSSLISRSNSAPFAIYHQMQPIQQP